MTLKTVMLLVVGLTAVVPAWTDRVTLPLPAPDKPGGTSFDTTHDNPEREVLTGLFLPESGSITAIAPLLATWNADGTLSKSQGGDWIGSIPQKILRVEKPGFLPTGLRLLLILTPDRSSVAQIQVMWRAWKEGTWSGPAVESPVWGKAAGANDTTRVVNLLIEEGGTPVGLWGSFDTKGLRQVSLVLYEVAPASTKSKSAISGASQSRQESPQLSGPTPPKAPTIPTVILGSDNAGDPAGF